MHSIAHQFAVNFIIDSGDLTDHGSAPENNLAKEISTFGIPYVFIRGNHDSPGTKRAVARQRNAIVLSGRAVTVDGLRIIGGGRRPAVHPEPGRAGGRGGLGRRHGPAARGGRAGLGSAAADRRRA